MKELLEAGVHFGHRTRRWNPKMRPYIFTERSGIHIIDLQQTMLRLNEYIKMVRDLVAKGGTVLFVGTKRQAQATVQAEADRCNMPYINQRWLGGTLTNWVTIKRRLDFLLQQERKIDGGEYRGLTKKEQLDIQREVDKLNHRIGGLKTMSRLPDLLFIVDTTTEELAVTEANKLNLPILAMVDTNSNPDLIEYVVPSNDDAIRAVKLIVKAIADAVEEGRRIREVDMADTGRVSRDELAEMEQYLGPSTLAKLKGVDVEDEAIDAVADEVFDDVVDDLEIADELSMADELDADMLGETSDVAAMEADGAAAPA
jgi:small subunit ribosomal protein S2